MSDNNPGNKMSLKFLEKSLKCFANGFKLVPNVLYEFTIGDELIITDHTYRLDAEPRELTVKRPGNSQIESLKQPANAFVEIMRKRPKAGNSAGWESVEKDQLLVYCTPDLKSRPVIASFDLDGTIIRVKSGARFPKDKDDWLFHNAAVVNKIKECNRQEQKVVIFTNQAGLTTQSRIADFCAKVENIAVQLRVPLQAFVAIGKTVHRKPCTGMWDCLVQEYNVGVSVDVARSFFVGDAAGRPRLSPKQPADHSNSDRLFALNVGMRFYTPEEYFLGQRPAEEILPKFDPRTLKTISTNDMSDFYQVDGKQEVVVMVGGPGSGKSYFATHELVGRHGYMYVNRDKLGSWQKCVSAMEKQLADGLSVVVDNTNPTIETRKRYVDSAKAKNVSIRCFRMATEYEHCVHNNRYRELTDASHAQVGKIIINQYKKEFVEPQRAEGFSEIVSIPFHVQKDVYPLYYHFLSG